MDRNLIEESLEKVLRSPSFQGSRRCQELLRYLVLKKLEGDTAALKERLIGSTLFGREPSYDTAADAIVRVKANEVRKRLAAYYGESGRDDPLRIHLPVGSYVPVFEWLGNGRGVAEPPERVEVETPLPDRSQVRPSGRFRTKWRLGVFALPVVLAGIIFLWWLERPPEPALERFWAPYLKSDSPVLICIPARERWFFEPEINRALHLAAAGTLAGRDALKLGPGDVRVVPDGAMSVQNFHAILRLATHLAGRRLNLEVRLVSEISQEEIRRRQVVLVGAYHNPWAMELNAGMRYSFRSENEGSREACWVQDAQAPSRRDWIVPRLWPHAQQRVDYAIVSRTFAPDTGQVITSLAGINGFGTQVAAEFLSSPDYWDQFNRLAPAGWEQRNCQIVLGTRVIREVPSPPRVLAVHCW